MDEPLVTVIMAVYNTGPYLKDAIESILNQSYTHIEFIIINSGSTDNSAQVIASYNDKRIRFINKTSNENWLENINQALKEAKGNYIARMDHDDISLKDRLRKQIDFLNLHPEIGMCGTWMRTFGEGSSKVFKYPLTPEECKVHLLFNIPILHPSLVLRKALVEKYGIKYKQEFFPADDMELLAVNSDQIKYANIPEVLFHYRVHEKQASNTMSEVHDKLKLKVQLIMLRKILPDNTSDEIDLFWKISFNHFDYTTEFLKRCETLLKKITGNNKVMKVFDQEALEDKIQQVWFSLCTDLASHKVYTFKIFSTSTLIKVLHFNMAYIRFYIKNFLILIKVFNR